MKIFVIIIALAAVLIWLLPSPPSTATSTTTSTATSTNPDEQRLAAISPDLATLAHETADANVMKACGLSDEAASGYAKKMADEGMTAEQRHAFDAVVCLAMEGK